MLKVGRMGCPFCHREDIYISRPKHFWEELAILLLLQPVRCGNCTRRFFRPVLASPLPKNELQEGPEKNKKHAT